MGIMCMHMEAVCMHMSVHVTVYTGETKAS